jgi:hypothetical protein
MVRPGRDRLQGTEDHVYQVLGLGWSSGNKEATNWATMALARAAKDQ